MTFSGFRSGHAITFGIDGDIAALAAYGNSADLLGGAIVRYRITRLSDGRQQIFTKTLENRTGTGYVFDDGFGMIDAVDAARAVP
jgi:hypothetical protein